jgi:predicted Zn finger-like uncharacterized protein
MDVRCDRCQTEYELEDDSVAETGASVQCTTCGHTFMVSRRKQAITPTPSPTTEMAAPGWLLMTEEGKTHRFRDPTTLQKWIVERRVGRNDRVTPPGASARRLGDMDELRPFFDLVDQADRAAAARVARPTQPETPQRMSGGRGYASPDDDDDDVLMNSRRSRGGGQRSSRGRLDSDIAAGLTTIGIDDSLGVVLPQRRIGRKIATGLVLAGLVAGGWYLGVRSSESKVATSTPAPASPVPPAATPPVPPPPPPVAPAAAAPATAAPAPAAAASPAPAAASPAPAAAPPAPPVATRPGGEDLPPEPLPPAKPPGRAPPSPDPGRPRSYESLVAEADRALENGNTAKAQKFIEEALRLHPNGVAAVTSNAFLLLDKQKPLAAVGEFKRALSLAPNFSQALFGLGEAYRSAGNPGQAIEAYKQYLAAAPGGPDAPAARRQVRELESQPARPSHSATANVPAPGNAPPPAPEPAPPP